MAKSSTAVAVAEPAALALPTNALPDYMSKNTGRGNENVEAGHLQIPRIKLLQKMSDEVDRHHANYVEGAKDGDFFNNLTGQNYGDALYAISVSFKDEFVVWRKREAGGGFGGTFATEAEARAFCAAQEKPADYDISQTHSHVLLIKDPATGTLSKPVIMDFSSSKLRVSRNWNSQIDIKGGDRFSCLWKLSSVAAKNKTGAQFMNLEVENMGWTTQEDYSTAENYYKQFAK